MAGTKFYNNQGNSEWILKRPLVVDTAKYWKSFRYLYPLGKEIDGTGHKYFYVTDIAMFEALLGRQMDYMIIPITGTYYAFPLIPYYWVSDYFENPKEWNQEYIGAGFNLVHVVNKQGEDCILLPVENPYVPIYIQTWVSNFTSGRTLIGSTNQDKHGPAFRFRTVSGSDICRVPADGLKMGLVIGDYYNFTSRFPRTVKFTASIYRYKASTQDRPQWVADLAKDVSGNGSAEYSQPSAYYDSWIYTPGLNRTWASPNNYWRTSSSDTRWIDAVGVGLLTIYTSNAGGTWTPTTVSRVSSWPQQTSLQHDYSEGTQYVYNAESTGILVGKYYQGVVDTWYEGNDGVGSYSPALMIPYSAGVILQAPTMGK